MKTQLVVNKNVESIRERVVRQNRLDLLGDSCTVIFGNTAYEIIDCSAFGLAFKADKVFEKNATFNDLQITFNGIVVNEISLRVARCDKQDNFYKIACEVIGQPIEVEKIIGMKSASSVVASHKTENEKYLVVPEEFRRIVFEMKVWLLSLREKVNGLGEKQGFNRKSEAEYFESTVANIVGSYIVDHFEPLYIHMQNKLKGISKEVAEVSVEFFRHQMIEILLSAPFHNRAYTKPLGYAGDYQMMNQIYSFESLGDDLFSKCLHLYFISAPESRAVRNRAKYLEDQIIDFVSKNRHATRKIRILSVASGPAFEIQKMMSKCKELSNLEIVLLDQDLEALQHAQRKIRSLERDLGVKVNLTLLNKSIKHVIAKGLDSKFDFIYSAGLFDYFADPVAQMACAKLYDALYENGKLIIGNFSNSSLGQITMDIALDWHLIYRSKEDLTRLFSEIDSKMYIENEAEGINLFCHLNKK